MQKLLVRVWRWLRTWVMGVKQDLTPSLEWLLWWHRKDEIAPVYQWKHWLILGDKYEKWVHPSNKYEKHYRALWFDVMTQEMRPSRKTFKRAGEALAYSRRYMRWVKGRCHAVPR